MVAYTVTHRDTRINADDQMPDMNLHKHCFIFNATYDAVEQKWKAAEIGTIKHDAPYFEAVYMNRLATNLKELGYGIERKGKAFEITGVSQELRDKFSRRTKYIEQVAAKLGITKPESKAKLGATTRLGKVKDASDDLNRYYVSRLTDPEKTATRVAGRAIEPCNHDGSRGRFRHRPHVRAAERGGRAQAVRDGAASRYRLGDAGSGSAGSEAAGAAGQERRGDDEGGAGGRGPSDRVCAGRQGDVPADGGGGAG